MTNAVRYGSTTKKAMGTVALEDISPEGIIPSTYEEANPIRHIIDALKPKKNLVATLGFAGMFALSLRSRKRIVIAK